MRGQNIYEGLQFTATKRARYETPAIPAYLYDVPLMVQDMPADEYNFRNKREFLPVALTNPVESPIKTPRKKSYEHISRRLTGGWGHVSETNPATISRRQEIQRLREDVKQQC